MRFAAFLCAITTAAAFGQGGSTLPPDYRGATQRVAGVYVTPVPGAPFTAIVDITSRQMLADGSERITTTVNHIARDGSGRIYNESRAMVPALGKAEPPLLSVHIYDPGTRQSIFLNPWQRLARESVIVPRGQPGSKIPMLGFHDGTPGASVSLGQQTVGSTLLEGTRKTWTIAAAQSGTGRPLVITDDYWYAPALSVYLIVKHDDPRTGEQLIAVRQVKEEEPDAVIFAVPSGYKIVDETPPQ